MRLSFRIALPSGLLLALLVPAVAGQVAVQGPPPPATPQTNQPEKPEPPANGSITGTVIDGSTGAPVADAIVFLTPLPARTVGPQTRQLTDEKGRFAFVNLPSDTMYSLAASKFGYLDGGYGRDNAPTDPLRFVSIRSDEWVSNLKVSIWKPGSISGVVRDESGEPVVGVFVRALLRLRIQGRDDVVAGPLTTTNDRGEYRISGLSPGRYLIQVPSVQATIPAGTKLPANPAAMNVMDGVVEVDDMQHLVVGRYPLPPPPIGGRQMAYPLMFHPSTSVVADATAIEMKFADDRPNVDLTLRPVPSVKVSGLVEGPPDALATLTLRLLPVGLENLGLGSEAATALVAPDGRFTFINVPAGAYTIDAPVRVSELSTQPFAFNSRTSFPAPPPSQGRNQNSDTVELIPGLTYTTTGYRGGTPGEYSGRASVTVGGSDVTGVVVRLRPHATMSGRVVVEPDPSQPDMKPPARFPVSLDVATGEAALGRPQRGFGGDGPPDQFTIPGIIPGQYWLRVQGYPGWIVKSIQWKGRDYSTTPFDATFAEDLSGVVVTVTNAVPELSGSVRGTDDLKADATIVIAFPTDQVAWRNTGFYPARVKAAAVSSTGTYRLATLPAGEYFVAAISRRFSTTWRDPAFLTQVARTASRVTLNWGVKSGQELNVVVIK